MTGQRMPSGVAAVPLTERVETWVLLLGVAGTPVIYLWGVTLDAFNLPKLSFLAIVTAIALGLRTLTMKGGPRDRSIYWPAACIAVPLLASWFASPYKEWALFGEYQRLQGLIPYLIVVSFGILLATSGTRPRQVLLALFAAGGVVALHGFLQAFGLDPLQLIHEDLFHNEVTGTIGNSNFVGGFLAIAAPAIVHCWIQREVTPVIAIPVTVLLMVTMFLTGSQGAWVAATCALGVLAYGTLVKDPRIRRAMKVSGALVAAGLVILMFLVVAQVEGVPETMRVRGRWWRAAVEMGAQRPIFGNGPNAFALEGASFRTEAEALELSPQLADDPHSIPLAFFANMGSVGVIGFLGLAVWAVGKHKRRDDEDPLRWIFMAGATAYLVQSLVTIDEPTLRVGLWSTLAGLALVDKPTSRLPLVARNRRLHRIASVAVLPAVIVVTYYSVRTVVIDHQVMAAFLEPARNPGDTIEAFEAALGSRDEYEYRNRYGYALGRIAASRGEMGTPFVDRMNRVFSYLDRFPDASARVIHARQLHELSVHDARWDVMAVGIYRRTLELAPYDPQLRIELAEVLLHLGRLQDARSILVDLLEKISVTPRAPRRAAIHGNLAIVHALDGYRDLAAEQIHLARNITSDDCSAAIAEELIDPGPTSGGETFRLGLLCDGPHLDLLSKTPS